MTNPRSAIKLGAKGARVLQATKPHWQTVPAHIETKLGQSGVQSLLDSLALVQGYCTHSLWSNYSPGAGGC